MRKIPCLFFLFLLTLLSSWPPLLSSSNIKSQDPIPTITNFSDAESLADPSDILSLPISDRDGNISDMSSSSSSSSSPPPSYVYREEEEDEGGASATEDGVSGDMGRVVSVVDGNEEFSWQHPLVPSRMPTRRSLLSLGNKQDTVLMSSLDGTIYLVECNSRKVRWSFSSGSPLSSSYQAHDKNSYVLQERNDSKYFMKHDYFVECGDDWNIYVQTKHGRMKLPVTIEKYVDSTPQYSEDGTIIVGEKKKIVFCVDAKTGRVIRTFPAKFGNDGQRLVLPDQYMGDPLKSSSTNIQTTDLLFITRTTYKLESYYLDSNEVAWNMTVSDIDFQHHCSGFGNTFNDLSFNSRLGLEYQGDEMPFPCHTKGVVYRTREQNPINMELRFLESRHEDEILFLPAIETQNSTVLNTAEENRVSLDQLGKEKDDGKQIAPVNSPPSRLGKEKDDDKQIVPVICAPSQLGKEKDDGKQIVPAALSIFIVSVALVLGVVIHSRRQKKHANSNKQRSDLNGNQTSNTKKRKNRKMENKNNASTYSQDRHENGGRLVGKLFVSNKEIAKGSNGTVVFEGIYDHRIPVAVKRLVLAHNDVAFKEYENLIASKQHQNIVHWYGVEQDSDFFYLPLERCTCNLSDLIEMYSDAFSNSSSAENLASFNITEYRVQLKSVMGIDNDTDLWQANGYPSSKMLKLMRDVVAGLAHLHELGIIHRDLKPQNVLISCEKSLCAKLSDMGISKRLNEGMSSLGHHATGHGSSGWQAPEQLLHGRQTRAVDIFSLGCIFFFCVTRGIHPFGDRLERDANIVKNHFDLFLVDHIPEAVDLFYHLLDPNPERRPKAKEVLHHPFFWKPMVCLWFLREVSDRVEHENRDGNSDLLEALENDASVALGGNWNEKMDTSFITDVGRRRRYKYDSVRDLLRLIRNKLNHYRELPEEMKELVGSVPEGFYNYFASRFPKLLIEVYKVIYRYCREEGSFIVYFTSDDLDRIVAGQLQGFLY